MEAIAKLNNVPTSPRKARLVADMIRGQKVVKALGILKFERRSGAEGIEKLLLSAIANWQAKNPETNFESVELYVKTIFVDGGASLKRMRVAPQGRGNRIRKRSHHVTLVVDALKSPISADAFEPIVTQENANSETQNS
jgi:large subunit ribosomal protein L22